MSARRTDLLPSTGVAALCRCGLCGPGRSCALVGVLRGEHLSLLRPASRYGDGFFVPSPRARSRAIAAPCLTVVASGATSSGRTAPARLAVLITGLGWSFAVAFFAVMWLLVVAAFLLGHVLLAVTGLALVGLAGMVGAPRWAAWGDRAF